MLRGQETETAIVTLWESEKGLFRVESAGFRQSLVYQTVNEPRVM